MQWIYQNNMEVLQPPKKANLIITKKMTSYRQIPYHFGNNPIHQVMINGAFVK